MARRRIPVVGTGQLNTAQLSPEERRILAHRARAAARREYAPVIAADRGATQAARAQYRSEAAGARGATSAVQDSLAQALAGLKASGLSGRYLQQTKGEFTSRAADAASALPSLLAGAREERGKAIGEARQTIAEDRAAMMQSAASKFNQTLKETRDKASSIIGAQEKQQKEAADNPVTVPYAPTEKGREAEEAAEAAKKQIALALQEAKRLLIAYPEEHPHDKSEWAIFAGLVSEADEVGPWAANKAVEILRKHAAKRAG